MTEEQKEATGLETLEFRLKQTKRPGLFPNLFDDATQYYLLLDLYINNVQYDPENQRAIAIPGRVFN